jgi:hypothetical protein
MEKRVGTSARILPEPVVRSSVSGLSGGKLAEMEPEPVSALEAVSMGAEEWMATLPEPVSI